MINIDIKTSLEIRNSTNQGYNLNEHWVHIKDINKTIKELKKYLKIEYNNSYYHEWQELKKSGKCTIPFRNWIINIIFKDVIN